MHSYPWVLVRAGNKKEAKQACEDWINSHIEGSAFDYGGPASDADDPEFKTVIQYGESDFLRVIRSCVEVEKASIKEGWDVVRQFVLKFAASKYPPPDSRKCAVTMIVAQGISGLVEAGKEVTHEIRVHECFLRMRWLIEMRKHMEYRCYMDSSDACLFVDEDTDVNVDELLTGKSKVKDPEELFLVHTDCHH